MQLWQGKEKATCEIPMKLPSLNEYVRACRTNRYMGAKMKANYEDDICMFVKRLPHFERPVLIRFHWVEESRRRDLDNVAFAKKFILDALVKSGVLENDDHKHVRGFSDTFGYGPEAKVIVTIEPLEEP